MDSESPRRAPRLRVGDLLKNSFDIASVRAQFPILKRILPNGKPLIYLDNAATSQKPAEVLAAMQEYYEHYNSNVHRAVHTLAGEATSAYEQARQKVSEWFGVPKEGMVLFTSGTTDALNLCAMGWARVNLVEGDAIVLSEMEHHSNIVPWQMLAAEKEVELRWVSVDTTSFQLDIDEYRELIEGAKLACMIHTSNVLGTRNPVEELVEIAHAAGARIVLDCAQGAAHERIDMAALGADFLAVTSHKMCGPTGIGALLIGEGVFDEMQPVQGGGDMIVEVTKEGATYQDNEHRYEAGTPQIAEAIGWARAIEWMTEVDIGAAHEHSLALARRAAAGISAIDGMIIYGDHSRDDTSGVVSFLHDALSSEDIAHMLDSMGIAVRTGHHCTQPLMAKLGVRATNRASFYLYNTQAEADALVDALRMIVERFG